MGGDVTAEQPITPAAALVMLEAALDGLNRVDVAGLPVAAQADCLRALERAEAKHTAARAGCAGPRSRRGAGSRRTAKHSVARPWLKWQTRVTGAAAAGAVAWVKRLASHPAVRRALAAGVVSASWAREICTWSDLLPERRRGAADDILLAVAGRRGGAG